MILDAEKAHLPAPEFLGLANQNIHVHVPYIVVQKVVELNTHMYTVETKTLCLLTL